MTEAGGVVERVEGGGVGPVAGSVMAANSEEGLKSLRVILALQHRSAANRTG